MNLPIKAAIVDDDAYIHWQLKEKLGQLPMAVKVVAACEDALEAVAMLQEHQPDLLFLDIHMPGMSGFELLQRLPERHFQVVFITSHNEYAIQAIRYSALDYLLKPIQADELQAAVERYTSGRAGGGMNVRLQNLAHNLANEHENFTLLIPTRVGEKSIPVKSIVYCKADSNYTHFFMSDRSRFTASKTLKEIAHTLTQQQFVRIHKSFLVNKSYVQAVEHAGFVRLNDNTRLEVSRRRMGAVRGELGGTGGV